MFRGRLVQLGPGRIALLAQARDEYLTQSDPLARRDYPGPLADVGQDVGDRLEVRQRMVELGHAGAGRMDVRIDQARQDTRALQVDHLRLAAARLEHVLVAADPQDATVLD